MPARDPAERALIARIAIHSRWAKEPDRAAATAAARKAAEDRWDRLVDPDGVLDPAERARRAEYAKTAHYQRMALKSAQARRRKAPAATT